MPASARAGDGTSHQDPLAKGGKAGTRKHMVARHAHRTAQPAAAAAAAAPATAAAIHDDAPAHNGGAGEKFDVIGALTGIAASNASERNAPNAITVRTAEEIRKLPDINMAEAISRMSGVSLQTDTGEGRFVNIRGLDADLSGVTFGGVRVMPSNQASVFGGARAVALDAIPAGMVASVVLTKTMRPDQDGEAMGGTIDLVPRTQEPNGKPFVEFDIGGGAEPLRGTPVVNGQITAGASFGFGGHPGPYGQAGSGVGGGWVSNPRPFSIFATAGMYNDQRGVDDVEEAYSDQQSLGYPDKLLSTIDMRRYQYFRRRYNRGGELDFDPNRDNHFFVRFAESGYHEGYHRYSLIANGLDSGAGDGNCPAPYNCLAGTNQAGFVAPQATFQKQAVERLNTVQNDMATWGGRNTIGRVRIDYHGAWSHGDGNFPLARTATFTDMSGPTAVGYNNMATPNQPTLAALDGTGYANRDYRLTSLADNMQKNSDNEWSGGANALIPLDVLRNQSSLKVGVLVRLRRRTTSQDSRHWTGDGTIPLSSFAYGPDNLYYKNQYNIGPFVDSAGIYALAGTPALPQSDPAGDAISSLQGTQLDHENVYAGYFQYEGNISEALHVMAGMRFEATNGHYQGVLTTIDANGNTVLSPATVRQNYFNYLPDVEFRYTFMPRLIGRLSYSTALARPGFNQNTASTTVDASSGTISRGNPGLPAMTSDAFDASLEYYTGNGGLISVGAFDKEISNYIMPRQDRYVNYGGLTGIVNVVSWKNIPHAQAYGFEAVYNQKFAFLPSILKYTGFEGNYTWINSTGQVHPGIDAPLPSTSNNNINAALYYEDPKFSIRVGVNYVSRNLFAIGGSQATDIWTADRLRVDMSASYSITKNLALYASVKNLTNTPLKFIEGTSDSRPIQREVYYETVLGGVRGHF